jgi:zinc protease
MATTVALMTGEAEGGPDPAAIADAVNRAVPGASAVRFVDRAGYGRDKQVLKFAFGNGLKVIVLEDHSSPLLSYQTWFSVGSRHETPGRTGIAHLFEHLMFKGTARFPQQVFDRKFEEAGAQTNAATWLDWTFYYENLPSSQLDLCVTLESDRMVHLALDQAQLDAEREVVKNERRMRVDNDPDGAMEEALFELAFPVHPYGRPTLGSMADLDRLTLDDCLAFYRTYYSASNATIVVVGDVAPEQALVVIARQYGSMPAVEVPRPVPAAEAEQTGPRIREMTLPIATGKAKAAWRTVGATHTDAYALDVVNEVMFANESARVYRALVEDKDLASDVDGASEALALDGVFLVDVTANEGRSPKASMEVVLAELQTLADKGPTAPELERGRNHLEASFLRSLATVGSRATQLGGFEATAGDYRRLFSFVEGVRAVTAADVQRVARKYLGRERVGIVYGLPKP